MSMTINYSWQEFDSDVRALALRVALDHWQPDRIVALSADAACTAVYVSQCLRAPLTLLNCNSADDWESCSWLAEDITGWPNQSPQHVLVVASDWRGQQVSDWVADMASCVPSSVNWSAIWQQHTRFASLWWDQSQPGWEPQYVIHTYDRREQPSVIHLPWHYNHS